MIISYQWLLQYLPKPVPVAELGRILTSVGLEVEAIEKSEAVKGSLEGLLIGKVLTCAPHPNADKLRVATVDAGGPEALHIVCGAPNVTAGQTVVVAPVGSTVHPLHGEPFAIKKAKIRGKASEGMICAEDEVGLGESHAGIMVLPEGIAPGTPAADYFKLPEADYAIHIGLTPNRSDANSHIGTARDVLAYLRHHLGETEGLRIPQIELPSARSGGRAVAVQVDAIDACPRYMGLTLDNVQVGPSPEWLQRHLETIGSRSINNVVDVTNYVLHEFGQPLHAFDADKIAGDKIVVRFEQEGSPFVSLDEKERRLQASDLMICDAEKPLVIAGVFGGLHSGVTEGTTRVFLESAYFHPTFVRRSSLHHGLRTDAATHFEKGVDINLLEPALKRAAAMLVELCGATIAGDISDNYPATLLPAEVSVSYDYIRRLSGKSYDKGDVKSILSSLGFRILADDVDGLRLQVPTNKPDVKGPADIVEEVLRIDGLDNIEIPARLSISLSRPRPNDRALRDKVAQSLAGAGFQEIVTNSITNSKYYEGDAPVIRLLNSLSSELDVMRLSMLESGLEVAAWNINRKSSDLLLFEFGTVYRLDAGAYVEEPRLALFASGNAKPAGWSAAAVKADAYFLKSVVTALIERCGITKTVASLEGDSITWKWKNAELARIEAVPQKKAGAFGIKQAVHQGLINWALWQQAAAAVAVRYEEVPRFPAVQRDLALVLDRGVSFRDVQRVTDKLKLQGLRHYGLFDVFESDKLGAGKKSLALTYTFQLGDRTLTDAETEALMKQLTEAYQKDLGAQIRS